ncbi:tetratricopeptide repeat protein [Phytohabitans rumicis]|uniref:tetratricopeptide repeat protein n=1 Tax=Phytohabitans rumicis TaxID=1076125 RepID=UPI0031E7BEB0
MRRTAAVVGIAIAAAIGVTAVAAVLGPTASAPTPAPAAMAQPADPIARAQERLRLVPGDWRTWAALAVAYVERGRVTADPTNYPRAEEAARRSLAVKPKDNGDALVAQGALANARHDFAAARKLALAATKINGYDADAYAVLADAETQLGNVKAATAAVQRLLDLRPGLSAYARGSYDLEQRGMVSAATDLMNQALAAAVSTADIGFCRVQLGDLAWYAGDLAGAAREYELGLAADPGSIALQRGRARVDWANGRIDAALAGYADLTRRAPTPSYVLEYAEFLRAAGRTTQAQAQLDLASTAHRLFTGAGGVDGLTGTALALAAGDPATALKEARAEWSRRTHADVADNLAWALHHAGRDAEALPYARRAVASGARSATYAYHLGVIELALGQTGAGRGHVAEAVRVNPYFSPIDAPLARKLLAGPEVTR